jgi:hypothetical protein
LLYCRQVIMLAMDHVRNQMREENLSAIKRLGETLEQLEINQ